MRGAHLLREGSAFSSAVSFKSPDTGKASWLLTTATHSEGKWKQIHDMAVSKMEKLKTKIPSLVSYKPFPQKTTDFSSHSLQQGILNSWPYLYFPAIKAIQKTRSPCTSTPVPAHTEHACPCSAPCSCAQPASRGPRGFHTTYASNYSPHLLPELFPQDNLHSRKRGVFLDEQCSKTLHMASFINPNKYGELRTLLCTVLLPTSPSSLPQQFLPGGTRRSSHHLLLHQEMLLLLTHSQVSRVLLSLSNISSESYTVSTTVQNKKKMQALSSSNPGNSPDYTVEGGYNLGPEYYY